MGNTGLSNTEGAGIRGPRRIRATGLPPEPTVEVHLDEPAARAASSQPPPPDPARFEVTARLPRFEPPSRALTSTPPRHPLRKAAWFTAGVLLGVTLVAFLRGHYLHEARALTSAPLRSLDQTPLPTATDAVQSEVLLPAVAAAVRAKPPVPCHEEVRDPCALPARRAAPQPMVADVPTFRIEDLPKVRPPVVWVPPPAARHRAPAEPAGYAAAEAPLVTASLAVEATESTEPPLYHPAAASVATPTVSAVASGSGFTPPAPSGIPSATPSASAALPPRPVASSGAPSAPSAPAPAVSHP